MIDLPSPEDFNGGAVVRAYLVPAAESATGRPAVTTLPTSGEYREPKAAWCGCWAHLFDVREEQEIDGAAIVEQLRWRAEELVALSDSYLGSEWDGGDHRGSWTVDPSFDLDWEAL